MWQLTYAADLGPKAGCYWASNDDSIPKQWFEMNSSYATVFARIFNLLAGQRSFFFEFTITCPVSFVLASLLISPALPQLLFQNWKVSCWFQLGPFQTTAAVHWLLSELEMPWIGTGLFRIWPLCLWLALSRPQIYLRLEPWVCFSDLSLWGLFLRSPACSNSSRWHHPASRVLLPPPYALRHTVYSLQYLYEN